MLLVASLDLKDYLSLTPKPMYLHHWPHCGSHKFLFVSSISSPTASASASSPGLFLCISLAFSPRASPLRRTAICMAWNSNSKWKSKSCNVPARNCLMPRRPAWSRARKSGVYGKRKGGTMGWWSGGLPDRQFQTAKVRRVAPRWKPLTRSNDFEAYGTASKGKTCE